VSADGKTPDGILSEREHSYATLAARAADCLDDTVEGADDAAESG